MADLDRHNTKLRDRLNRGRRKLAVIRDKRRAKFGSVSLGSQRVIAPIDTHTTLHPKTVARYVPGQREALLKPGENSPKLGGRVLRGSLRGAAIYSLALVERETCPTACPLYRECYGNNMHRTRRWRPDPVFEAALEAEARALCAENEKVLIRLHTVGDFYSMDYLALWVGLLDDLPNLSVFGFTAHRIETEIGAGVDRVRRALGKRFAIRHSGMCRTWGAFTVDFPTQQRFIGDAVVCPEQRETNGDRPDRGTHCGSCAVCWETNRAIAFILHGEG